MSAAERLPVVEEPSLTVGESLRRLAGLSPSQRTMLASLGEAGEPMTAGAVAESLGIRASSARETLDVLVTTGLVQRRRMPVTGPGRPSFGYEAVAPTDVAGAVTMYVDVLVATASVIRDTHPDPESAAREIGRRWADGMVGGALPDHRGHDAGAYDDLDLGDHMDKIAFFFSALGFGACVAEDRRTIVCRSCPFARDGHVDPLLWEVHRGMSARVVEVTSRGRASASVRPGPGAGCEVVVTEVSSSGV